MDDWQTQNKSIGCIPHLPSIDMQVVKTYNPKLIGVRKINSGKSDKLRNSKVIHLKNIGKRGWNLIETLKNLTILGQSCQRFTPLSAHKMIWHFSKQFGIIICKVWLKIVSNHMQDRPVDRTISSPNIIFVSPELPLSCSVCDLIKPF